MAFGGAMKRVLTTVVVSLIFLSVWQALGLNWPFFINMVFLPPIILVFALQNFKLMETIVTSLFIGLLIDSMGGFLIGVNMTLMLVMSFVMVAINLSSGRIHTNELTYYVMGTSFVYRILLLLGQLILQGTRTNFSWLELIIGPIIDGLISHVFYYLLIQALVLVKAIDRTEHLRKHGLGRFR